MRKPPLASLRAPVPAPRRGVVLAAALLATGPPLGAAAAAVPQPAETEHAHHASPAPIADAAEGGEWTPLADPPRPPRTLVVGEGREFATLGEALAVAVDGDTVVVDPGVYRERPVVRRAVRLVGRPGAILDGGGEGTVLTLRAPATVTGLWIRGSGVRLEAEHAGILAERAHGVTIEGNRLTDVLFGIYLKQSDDARIQDNRIEGKQRPIPRRGDGIRLWYCRGGRIEGNLVRGMRDLVIWFSNGLLVRDNRVTDGRYGLHYMYSDDNRFEDNRFERNQVGAFLMYSARIEFRRNLFLRSAGASGMGLGLKDADDITAVENAFVGNAVGIFLDNSPNTRGAVNRFERNLLSGNDVGFDLLPSVAGNEFTGNAVTGNLTPVTVTGGGDALANRWRGNRWSEYAGFDRDGDGIGDTPFRWERVAADLFARHPELRLFALGPAASALELLGRVFPLLRPKPVVIDSAPRVEAVLPRAVRERWAGGDRPAPAAAAGLFTAALLAGLAIGATHRRGGRS